ncbi:MAG: AMP-binding protein, partial [Acetobacteraceae bacterium]|nr:AMP-binding protein [Acetobacteraceae bacterium]
DRQWTARTLSQAADRVAARLLACGLNHGDRVVAYGRNSDAYLLAWLGCVRAGLVHVPANYALSAKELEYILTQSGAEALVHDAGLGEKAMQAAAASGLTRIGAFEGGGAFDILAAAQDPALDIEFPDRVADEDLAQILYTSGTTGAPKGAMLTHRAILAQYLSCIVGLEFSESDRALAALPLYHSAQMHAFTMPQLLAGTATTLIESPVPAVCLELIERHRITSFFAPPTVWINLLRHDDFARRDLSSLRNVYYGAAIMPVPVLQELRQRLPGARPFNCYGQSEIAPLATVLKPCEHHARPSSVGRPVLNVQTRVVDQQMRDVPPGERGEIIHRSPQLMLGYWDKPEETEQAFAGGWFHSGDIGTMDEEGYIFIVDRVKDVINTGGVLVASREVEEALFTHPAVSEVAVIALPDPTWIEAITAVVVLRPGVQVSAEDLITHARVNLAPYKLPKRVIFAESLPKNTAGKLLKRELRLLYGGQAEAVMGIAETGSSRRTT